jgi:iron-sulfur cluster repair protein YtfE (RIC family)
MNIDKFKHQHIEILTSISTLRALAQSGIRDNATAISERIIAMSSLIKLHLAVEDKVLYPTLQNGKDALLARMGKKYQDEMKNIAAAYMGFARRWNTSTTVAQNPEGFRRDANEVLKVLHTRMRKENTEFYPAIEAC